MKLPSWISHAHFYRFACVFTGLFFFCFLSFALYKGQTSRSHSTVLRSREIFQKRVEAEKNELSLLEEREKRNR